MKKEKCLRCGYQWVKRMDKPIVCPRCKNPYWNLEKNNAKRSLCKKSK